MCGCNIYTHFLEYSCVLENATMHLQKIDKHKRFGWKQTYGNYRTNTLSFNIISLKVCQCVRVYILNILSHINLAAFFCKPKFPIFQIYCCVCYSLLLPKLTIRILYQGNEERYNYFCLFLLIAWYRERLWFCSSLNRTFLKIS